jgi:hypothetical protein
MEAGFVFGFHYSPDGKARMLIRYFTLGNLREMRMDIPAQSPTGGGREAAFVEIRSEARPLADIRSGE